VKSVCPGSGKEAVNVAGFYGFCISCDTTTQVGDYHVLKPHSNSPAAIARRIKKWEAWDEKGY
jgi:hypothetical protein